jgi:hypothetical protein
MASFPKSRGATTIGNSNEARTAEAAKTARLRALRLAKEADDREAEKSAARATANPPRTMRAPGSVRGRQKSANSE